MPLQPLHLYRHLLREASYLPTPLQPYIRTQITTRFRKHRSAKTPPQLTTHRLRNAHSNLRALRAANAGHYLITQQILRLVYGRVGRRRRILMSKLLHSTPGAATTTAELERQLAKRAAAKAAALAASSGANPWLKPKADPNKEAVKQARRKTRLKLPPPPEPDWLEGWDLPKLHALAASQVQQSFLSQGPSLRNSHSLAPNAADIPLLSTWGKPLGPRLARLKLRKWYVATVKRIMPPLEREEWEALGRLARGEGGKEVWRVRGRRAKAAEEKAEEEKKKKAWDWRLYATAPVRSLERGQSRSIKSRTGEEGVAPYGNARAVGLKNIQNKRMWERMYMRLWESCPTMEERVGKDGDREWKVLWGGAQKVVQKARSSQMAFFENVPEGAAQSKKRKTRKMAQ